MLLLFKSVVYLGSQSLTCSHFCGCVVNEIK